MAAQHLCDRYAQAVAAVADFFAMYYGVDVAQSEDAQEDLVLFALGGRGTVVAVSADFLAEFEPLRIRENLAAWNVAHLSRTLERGCRLIITSEGAEEERS